MPQPTKSSSTIAAGHTGKPGASNKPPADSCSIDEPSARKPIRLEIAETLAWFPQLGLTTVMELKKPGFASSGLSC
jgi:hypothetical protein